MNYSLLKLLHVAAVIIFLGNIITGHFWMHLAIRSRDINIVKHSVRGIMKSDKIFTIPSVVTIISAGILAAFYGNISVLHTGWIVWSIGLFSFSGVIFSTRLTVILRRMLEMTIDPGTDRESKWTSLDNSYKQWNTWALIAILMPVTALIMMVLKVPA